MAAPKDIEAEAAILGAMMTSPEAAATAVQYLRESDFSNELYRGIYAAAVFLFNSGSPIDPTTISSKLERGGLLDDVGGVGMLRSLVEATPNVGNAEAYADAVKRASTSRRVVQATYDLQDMVRNGNTDPDKLMAAMEDNLLRISEETHKADFTGLREVMFTRYQNLGEGSIEAGLPTGYNNIDEIIGGLVGGRFYILAARPGIGKTSWSVSVAKNVSLQGRGSVLFYSLEMSKEELSDRIISATAGVVSNSIRSGRLDTEEYGRVFKAIGACENADMHIDDNATLTFREMRAKAKRFSAAKKVALIVVDYLQLMSFDGGRTENRQQEVSMITRGLKGLAKELQVPILALSQLNRQVEERRDKRPQLSDLRECLPADSLVVDSGTGSRVTIGEIFSGRDASLWSLDEEQHLGVDSIAGIWEAGEKNVYEVTTRTGRKLACSSGHRLLSEHGWKELRNISIGESVAVPRGYSEPTALAGGVSPERSLLLGWFMGNGYFGGTPTLTVRNKEEAVFATELGAACFDINPTFKPEHASPVCQSVSMTSGFMCGAGKNPFTTWLREVGVWGTRAATKYTPDCILRSSNESISAYLRGLFHADGTMPENKNGRASAIKLSTVSHTLAVDVQHLLLRLGIIASVKEESQAASGYRSSSGKGYVVIIDNIDMTSMFVNKVGFMFDKQEKAIRLSRARVGNAQGIDLLPRSVNGHIREMQESGMSWKDIGWREQGKRMTRRSALAVAERTGDKTVAIFANSSVMWDEVVSVTLRSYEMTYDLTVDKTSNFVVNDIITHNSGAIEQDADVVAFLYFEPDDVSRTLAQVMFDKNRFGPRGLAKLVFTPEFTRFREHIPAAT